MLPSVTPQQPHPLPHRCPNAAPQVTPALPHHPASATSDGTPSWKEPSGLPANLDIPRRDADDEDGHKPAAIMHGAYDPPAAAEQMADGSRRLEASTPRPLKGRHEEAMVAPTWVKAPEDGPCVPHAVSCLPGKEFVPGGEDTRAGRSGMILAPAAEPVSGPAKSDDLSSKDQLEAWEEYAQRDAAPGGPTLLEESSIYGEPQGAGANGSRETNDRRPLSLTANVSSDGSQQTLSLPVEAVSAARGSSEKEPSANEGVDAVASARSIAQDVRNTGQGGTATCGSSCGPLPDGAVKREESLISLPQLQR